MGTYVGCEHLYDNIKKTNPAMSNDEIKEEMERFITQSLISPLSEDQILDMISEHPIIGLENPRPMPRFTPEQREQRRQKSAALRGIMFDDVIYEHTYFKDLTKDNGGAKMRIDRHHQRLFRQVNPADTPEQQEQTKRFNQELTKLFDTDPRNLERNNEELRRSLISENPGMTENEANQTISRRRAQIVMSYLRSYGDAVEHLDELTNPELPTEQLTENFKKIIEINHIFAEMENFKKDVPALYTLPDEDMQWIESQNKYLSEATVALEKMRMIANPAFEFIDFNCLEDYALKEFMEAETADGMINDHSYEYQARDCDEAQAFIAQQKERDPCYAEYAAAGVYDNVTQFFGDADFLQDNSDLLNFERMARDLGFTPGDYRFERMSHKSKWEGHNLISYASTGDPVAAVQNGRAVIFRYVGNRLRQEAPETIYNDKLTADKTRLSDMMKKADPWYHPSSPVFKTMRKAFEEAKKVGEIKKGESPSEAFRRYRELLKASEDYLKTKPENSERKWEKRHIEMGKALRTFAEKKLNQLEKLQQARDTQQLFAGKTPEQIRAFAAQHDKVAKDAKNVVEQRNDREAHKNDPAAWVMDRLEHRYEKKIPKGLYTLLELNAQGFKLLMEDNRLYEGNQQHAQTTVANLVGNMIAAELILREKQWLKADVPGPLETRYNDLGNVSFTALGEKAMIALTGKGISRNDPDNEDAQPNGLTPDELKNFVETFDPKALMEQLSGDIYKENNLSPVEQQLTGQLVNSIKPMRRITFDDCEKAFIDFAKTRIVEPIKGLEANNARLDRDAARRLVSDCVIYSMIQLERTSVGEKGPCAYEKLLTGNANEMETLRNQVEADGKFNEMLRGCTDVDGNLSLDNATKLLNQRAPQKLALGIMQNIAQEQQQQNQQQQQRQQQNQQQQQQHNQQQQPKLPG